LTRNANHGSTYVDTKVSCRAGQMLRYQTRREAAGPTPKLEYTVRLFEFRMGNKVIQCSIFIKGLGILLRTKAIVKHPGL
jgi:hypothetical protein